MRCWVCMITVHIKLNFFGLLDSSIHRFWNLNKWPTDCDFFFLNTLIALPHVLCLVWNWRRLYVLSLSLLGLNMSQSLVEIQFEATGLSIFLEVISATFWRWVEKTLINKSKPTLLWFLHIVLVVIVSIRHHFTRQLGMESLNKSFQLSCLTRLLPRLQTCLIFLFETLSTGIC